MRWPQKQLLLTLTLLGLALALRIADPQAVQRLRLSVFDTYQRLAPREPDPATPVRVVDIDDASLAELGQWPWPRTRLAELIDKLHAAGAASIALDIVLAEPDRFSAQSLTQQLRDVPALQPLLTEASKFPDNDLRLAQSIAASNVVVGVSGEYQETGRTLPPPKAGYAAAGDDPKLFVPPFPGGTSSLAVLADKASGIGAVNWLPQNDQIVRRVPLLITIGDALYPSLSVEQLRVAAQTSTIFIKSSSGSGVEAFGQQTGLDSVRVGDKILSSDGDGQMWIHFSPYDRARYTSAASVLSGKADLALIAGRHIVVGSSATGLLDIRATPLDASVPGVEVHAQALEQMLAGDGVGRPAWATGAELVLILTGGGLMAWLMSRSRPALAAALGAAGLGAITLFSWYGFRGHGLLFDPVYPAIALTALYLTGSLLNYIETETERTRVRSAFSHYLSPPLVEQLAADPGKLKLGGETREITVLIADMRGFSRRSEGMDAGEILSFVNSVFTPLTEIILDEGGTIDKFMGDAVMAFWNAPLEDPDHASKALRAALRMLEAVDTLNTDWQREAEETGKPLMPLRLGIGINTGPCSVGNIGSPLRVNYSIIGDPVNTAARLEETTKLQGAPALCGGETAARARNFALLEIGAQSLRGKDRTERMFVVAGDEQAATREEFKSLRSNHAALVQALADGDSAGAAKALKACRAIGWKRLDGLWETYTARL